MAMSIVFSYPLMFAGLREAAVATLKAFMPAKGDRFDEISFQNVLTLVIIAGITIIAFFTDDPSMVVGLVGSLLGCSVIYLLPAFFFVKAHQDKPAFRLEVIGACLLFLLGVALAILGVMDVISEGDESPGYD
mmetsp:Transcript_74326/g.128910  ORF Transcript_74326/g.128910 Transcript_74326/m.128910 type:complete len:133 (+) Transcript_74326:1-399(+)